MEVRYLVAKSDRGYEAKFDFCVEGPMHQEQLAKSLGYQILLKGKLSNPSKVQVVQEVVKQANREGNFDPTILEKRLLE